MTNFFLDCFQHDELERLVAKVAASAADNARWLLVDFRLPECGWRKWRAKAVLALMYAFFRVTTGLSASRLTPAALDKRAVVILKRARKEIYAMLAED